MADKKAEESGSDWTEESGSEDEDAKRKSFLSNMKASVAQQSFKSVPCEACSKLVDFSLQLTVDGHVFHKACFRCKECERVLSPGTYAGLNGNFYCKPHFKQLFQTKGNYSESFGHEDPKKKWQAGAGPGAGEEVEGDAAEEK